jgi:hypothetical protein
VQFQLQTAVEVDPQMGRSGFTRWVMRVRFTAMMVLH